LQAFLREIPHHAGAVPEQDRAGIDTPARVIDQARDRHGGDRLARPGLAHHRQRFTIGDAEVQIPNSREWATVGGERDGQTCNFEERRTSRTLHWHPIRSPLG